MQRIPSEQPLRCWCCPKNEDGTPMSCGARALSSSCQGWAAHGCLRKLYNSLYKNQAEPKESN